MTCQEVQDQLLMLAAGECDPPTRAALESHLRQCQTCAVNHAESLRLVGMLELHFDQDRVKRLQQRIEEAAQPRRKVRFFTPFVRRAGLLAAALLIAVGVIWLLPREEPNRKGLEPQFALLVRTGKPELKVDAQVPAALKDKGAEAVAMVPLAARGGGDAFRRELEQAKRDGKLPLPPAVFLELVLVNSGKRPVDVRLGDEAAHLWLEIPGDGVERIDAPNADTPEALRPHVLQLDPGQQHVLRIDRLVAGSPRKLEYIYLTEPGEVALTPRLRLTADGVAVTVTGPKVRIKVGNQPVPP